MFYKRGLALVVFSLLVSIAFVSAATFESNSVSSPSVSGNYFTVKTLKYEPFPVTPGDWFDLWIKVENNGEDAPNAQFELVTEYPFSSEDNIRSFGLVPGAATAYRERQSGESENNANQVILKYRVFVAENAPSGETNIKLRASFDANNSIKVTYDLPIDIEKTKADFDITPQSMNAQGISFAITNIGEALANTVIVKINSDQWSNRVGDSSFVISKLGVGDSTRFFVSGTPVDKSNIDFSVSYTDESGVRRELAKESSVNSLVSNSVAESVLDKPYIKWIFALIGILVGVIIMIVSRKIHHKKRGLK